MIKLSSCIYLEQRLPVGIKYEFILGMESFGRDVILLRPLVGEVVTKGPREDYLSVIVDITSNLVNQSASNSL